MKTFTSSLICLLLLTGEIFAQVSVSTDGSAADPSSMLDVKSNAKGILYPRLTTTERDAIMSPANSLMIFNTTTMCLEIYNSMTSSWESVHCLVCPSPASPIAGNHVPSQTQIIWNWNAVSGAIGYKWNNLNDYGAATDMGTANNNTETGLTCNTSYTSYVWAYDVCGNSSATTLSESTSGCWTCGQSLTDSRNGQTYNTVQLGSQCWMAQNLNYQTGNSWCYDNNTSNCTTYGRLYDWQTALGACPSGWHLPGDNEWTTIIDFVNSQPSYQCNSNPGWIGKALAATILWNSSTNTCAIGNNPSLNNATGFSGIPGGNRINYGFFFFIGLTSYWWTSTEYDGSNAWIRIINYSSPEVNRAYANKELGYSVRCLKDN